MLLHTHRYHQKRLWTNFSSVILTVVALFFAQHAFSTDYYARANGSWNNENTWSLDQRSGKIAGSCPSSSDNIFITGYMVFVTEKNASAASINISNKLNDDARLIVENGKTLTVSGEVIVTSYNTNKTTDIWIQGHHSTLRIMGNLSINREKSNVQTASNQVLLGGTSTLFVKGDVIVTMQNSAPGFSGEIIVLNNESQFLCGSNLVLRMAKINNFSVAVNEDATLKVQGNIQTDIRGGNNFDFRITGNAKVNVNGDFTLTQIGGEKVTISAENNVSGNNQFYIGGNFTILHETGDHLAIQALTNGGIFVKGNFKIDWTGSTTTLSELRLSTNGNGAITVNGSMNINMTDPNNGKLMVDLDDQSKITIGLDDGNLTQITNLNLIKGSVFDFKIDQEATFTSYGDLSLNHNGDNDMFVQLNHESFSILSEAKLVVKGDLLLNKTNGSQSFLDVAQNGKILVHGNAKLLYTDHNNLMQIDVLHLSQTGTFEVLGDFSSTLNDKLTSSLVLNLKDSSHFKIGDSLDNVDRTASFNVTRGFQLILNIDNDATLEVNGDFINNFDGTGPLDIMVSFKENGLTHDAKINIRGNWSISKTNGDRFYFIVDNDANIHINKDFTIQSNGHDLGDLTNESIILKGNAVLDINGSFNYTLNEPVQHNDLILNLEDHAALTVGEDNNKFSTAININLNGGNNFDFDINGNAKVNVFGDFNISQNTGNQLNIDLNKKLDLEFTQAKLQIANNLNINKSNSSQFKFHAQKNAVIEVKNDFIFESKDHKTNAILNEQLQLSDNAMMTVGGNFSLQMDDPLQENILLVNLSNNVILNTGSTLEDSTVITTVDGLNMEINIDDNAVWNTSGDFSYNYLAGVKSSNIGINANSGTNAHLIIGGNLALNNIYDDSKLSLVLYQANSLLHVEGNIDMRSAVYSNQVNITLENSSMVELGGNFLRGEEPYRNGSFTANGTSTLSLIGSKPQFLAQSRGDGTDEFIYQNLIINNTSNSIPQITTEGDVNVRKSITFLHGIISTNNDAKLVLMETGTVNSASNVSYVDGIFGKVGNTAFTFPIGNGGFYAPLTISGSKTKPSQFDAQYIYSSVHAAGFDTANSSSEIVNISNSEYWILNRPYGNANVSVSLNWHFSRSNIMKTNSLCDIKIARWDGFTWQSEGNGGASGDITSGTITTGNKNNCESLSKVTSWVCDAPITIATTPKNEELYGLLKDSSIEK
jgi:hypothetical protein